MEIMSRREKVIHKKGNDADRPDFAAFSRAQGEVGRKRRKTCPVS